MDELVGYLMEAYRQSITDLEWMSDGCTSPPMT
jgi:hypothetical protein